MKWLVFLFLFLTSCIDKPVTELFSNSDGEGARNQLRERIRSRSLSDSSVRCSESRDCKETCEDIYLKATDLDRCYDSTESRVKAISEVFDILVDPDRLSDLNDIDPKDFAHFLNIGWRAFLDLIDPIHRDEDGDRRNTYWEDVYAYDVNTAQLVLEWIANEEKIARSISSKDEDMDIVRHLFCIAGRSVPEEEQTQYICELWDLDTSECDSLTINNLEAWTNTVNWQFTAEQTLDDSITCHDNPASIYIGLTQGEYDDVGFSTYAEAQDNNQAQELEEDMIANICGIDSACLQFYSCPALIKYKGYEFSSLSGCSAYQSELGGL